MNDFNHLQSLAALAEPRIPDNVPVAEQWSTAKGARVMFFQAHALPMVDVWLNVRAGSGQEGPQPGMALLLASLLDEGIAGTDALGIIHELDRLGARLNKQVTRDCITLNLRSLSDPQQLLPALDLLGRMLAAPLMPQASVEKMSRACSENAHHARLHGPTQLEDACRAHVFAGHPYGRPAYGTQEDFAAITREQLVDFHQRAFCASNLEISLVGDLSSEQARQLTERLCEALAQGAPLPAVADPGKAPTEVLHIEQEGARVDVKLVIPTLYRSDPDYRALQMAARIFGGSIQGRLFNELRTRRGLTYGAYAQLVASLGPSLWQMTWSLAPEYNDAAQELVEQMLRDFIEQGPTPAELAAHQQAILLETPIAIASNAQILGVLADLNLHRQPADGIRRYLLDTQALTVEEVRLALQRHLDLDTLLFASIGPSVAQVALPALPA